MFSVRGLAVWLLIIIAESIQGTLRQVFLAPLVGDFTARRIAFFGSVLLIFLLEDYDIRRGGLMLFGMIFIFFAPYLAAKLRGENSL